MNSHYKVNYAFVQLPDKQIADFADTVIAGLTGNVGFPNLPVSLSQLETQKAAYLAILADTAPGSPVARAEKNEARNLLAGSLRRTAAYVQHVAGRDLALLRSSGFQPASTDRAPGPLKAPLVLNIDNRFSRQLVLRVQAVPNARAYEAQIKNGGDWQPAGIFTQARRIILLEDLTPGNAYTVQVRTVGGKNGYSDWSAPQAFIAR